MGALFPALGRAPQTVERVALGGLRCKKTQGYLQRHSCVLKRVLRCPSSPPLPVPVGRGIHDAPSPVPPPRHAPGHLLSSIVPSQCHCEERSDAAIRLPVAFPSFTAPGRRNVPAGGVPFARAKGTENTPVFPWTPVRPSVRTVRRIRTGPGGLRWGPTGPAMTWRFALHTGRYEGYQMRPTSEVPCLGWWVVVLSVVWGEVVVEAALAGRPVGGPYGVLCGVVGNCEVAGRPRGRPPQVFLWGGGEL